MFSQNNLFIEGKSGTLKVAQLKWNLSLLVKQDCDLSMGSFITVYYETSRITFQNRGSGSLLGFEEEHPHLASKISKR